MPMAVLNLYSSNNKLVYTRKYTSLMDVAANVGGISYIAFISIFIIYGVYNHLRMKQDLLNYGILNRDDSDEKKDFFSWEKSRFFSFSEIVRFALVDKGMPCLGGKSKKYVFY